MDMKLARQVAKLIATKRDLEDELSATKEKLSKLEPSLLNELAEEQMDKLHCTVDGQRITLYRHAVLWAKPVNDRNEVVEVLKKCGLSDFVAENYNSNSLSAYVRERLAAGEELQPTLDRVIDVSELVSIRGRRTPSGPLSMTAKARKHIKT
tara:strand:- start:2080 stop:2535 length:456 start_codon:yes stop_codon:yes gene_type:complete